MSLRRRTLLLAAVTVLMLVAGLSVALQRFVLRAFDEAEIRQSEAAVASVERALSMTAEDLDLRMADWADWDDAADYAQSGAEEFEQSNLILTSMRSAEWHLFALWTADRGLRAIRYADAGFTALAALPPRWAQELTESAPLLREARARGPSTHGFVVVDGEVWLVASRPVRRSDLSPAALPARMVVGRRLGPRWIERIQRLTRLSLRVDAHVGVGSGRRVAPRDGETLVGVTHVRDISGVPSVRATVTLPRAMHAQSERLVRVLLYALGALSLLSAAISSADVHRAVVLPLGRLAETARRLGRGEAVRARTGASEEIDTLARAFNAMADDLDVRAAAEREAAAALRSARDTAEAALAARSAFLATMSHEIRTPMNGVLGMATLLEDSALDAEQREWVQTLRGAGEALLTILNDVLDLSKIEAGRLAVEVIPFDLAALCRDVVRLFSASAQQRGISIRADTEGLGTPGALGDPTRVRQVLVNLVGNAVKFTHAGSVCITARRGDDDRVQISVRDSGIGMSPEALGRLFEPFAQADSSFARRYGGTGLGLAISARITELMGGALTARSVEGEGSEFTLELPLPRPASPLAPRTTFAGAAPGRAERPTRARGRVLAAEDNDVNRKLLERFLQKLGFACVAVTDGAAAVEALRGGAFDAVLMDCQMPVVDGFEATRRIRAGEVSGERIPILALTANAMKGDRERCLEAGMDDYLTKPLRLAELEAALVRWIPGAVRGDVA